MAFEGDEMQADDAGNQKALSDAKEDLALTRDVRSADVKSLQTLKKIAMVWTLSGNSDARLELLRPKLFQRR